MKLCRFAKNGTARIGVFTSGMVDLSPILDDNMADIISQFETVGPAIRAFLDNGHELFDLSEVRLLPPMTAPGKILCSGINYRSHFAENPKAVLPRSPFFFTKLPNTVVGFGDSIVKPDQTKQLDYEVELALVIGRRMSKTAPADAMAGVFGYTILNDVSARDVQFTDNQITLGKNFDTFAPIGPWIVTADELTNPQCLTLKTLVNGRILQDGLTTDWVYQIPELLAALTSVITLEPGDIVTTGTPAGVGYFQNPQVFLEPGDEVRLEIEGIGSLVNTVTRG